MNSVLLNPDRGGIVTEKDYAYLGLAGRYEAGLIRHRNLSDDAVRIPIPPSSKLTNIDWLSHEYVACVIGPLASRGTHYY